VIDALSGVFVCALGCPLFTHEAREMLTLHPLLRRGDVLVGDRALCSYVQIALLMRRGVDVVLRLHQRRPTQALADYLQTWTRPPQRPDWMSESTWQSLPQQLVVRIVRYVVNQRGSRTKVVYVATSLLDQSAYPHETIMRLYGHRSPRRPQDAREDEHVEKQDGAGRDQGADHVPDRVEPGADDHAEVRAAGGRERVAGKLHRHGAMAARAADWPAADRIEVVDQSLSAGSMGAEEVEAADEGV